MNPKIKELIEQMRAARKAMIAGHLLETGSVNTEPKESALLDRAATILQAVFDPENQPSQYGTTLTDT